MEEVNNQLEETLDQGLEPAQEVEQVEEVDKEVQLEPKPAPQENQNIRQLREAKERSDRERDEMYRRLREIELRQEKASQPKEEQFNEPAPDDLVEWKTVDRRFKKLEEENRRYRQQSELSATEIKLKSQFNDFDSVVSAENIELLRTMEPELADSINSNPNLYTKAVAAYKAIKRLEKIQDPYAIEKEKITKNASKPRPSNAASPQSSDSPLAQANAFGYKLTEDQKKALWKEMRSITGRG